MPPDRQEERADGDEDGPYGVAWLHLDPARSLELLREFPPGTHFGDFGNHAYLRQRDWRGAHIPPGPRIVQAIEAVLRDRGELGLLQLEKHLLSWIVQWPPDGPAVAARALRARWPATTPRLERLAARLEAWAELRALGLPEATTTLFEFLLDLSRPPLSHPAFAEALGRISPEVPAAELRAVGRLLPARAPTAARLLGRAPELVARMREEAPSSSAEEPDWTP